MAAQIVENNSLDDMVWLLLVDLIVSEVTVLC